MNNISRKLTNIEKGMEILNLHGGTSNVILASKITGNLSIKVLRESLNQLQAQTPFLQCRITKSDQDWFFTTKLSEEIPLRVVHQERLHLESLVEKDLNQAIDSSKHLIRATAICCHGSEQITGLIITTHHSISDAMSCIALHEKLFKLCQLNQSNKAIYQAEQPLFSPQDLICVEDFMSQELFTLRGQSQKIIRMLNEVIKSTFRKHQVLASEQTATLDKYKCGFSQRKLSPELSAKIINNCRKNNVTFQGAICAAMLMSAANQIKQPERQKIRVTCRSGVDVRKLLDPPVEPEKLGVFAAPLTTSHKISAYDSFWDLAREVVQKINIQISGQEAWFNLMILDTLFEYLASNPDKIYASTVDVTNVGKINIEDSYGDFELDEISFTTSNRILSNSILVAVTTFKQKIILNFVVSEPSISAQTRETLASNVVDYLINQ